MNVWCARPSGGRHAATFTAMETVDVLVVGAGLAGLHTARLLAEQGHDVLVVDRRGSLAVGIRTTGIFVRRTLEDFVLPDRHLGPAIRRVLLYPPSLREPVELVSSRDEFRVADMAGVYAEALAGARRAGAQVRLGVSYPVNGVTARFTIGADGARSTVARRLGLDVNRHVIIGAEEVYPVAAVRHRRRCTAWWILAWPPAISPGSPTTGSTLMSGSRGNRIGWPARCRGWCEPSAPASAACRRRPARCGVAAVRSRSVGCSAGSSVPRDCWSATRPAPCRR